MRNIERMRFSRYELMDMATISYYTLSVSYMEVPSNFIDIHIAVDTASFIFIDICKWKSYITYALFRFF